MNKALFFLLLLISCGKNQAIQQDFTSSSIIGGEDVQTTELAYKSTVALISDNNENIDKTYRNFVCTGILISADLILTAHHCIEKNKILKAFFGNKVAKEKPKQDDTSVLISDMRTVVRKFKGDPETDIALLKLSQKAPLGFEPVPLIDPSYEISPGTNILMAGFGKYKEMDYRKFDNVYGVLKSTHAPFMEYKSNLLLFDQRSGHGACNGDSGGPAYLETNKGLIAVGATQGPAEEKLDCIVISQFVNIAKYKEFILKSARNMKAHLPEFMVP